MSFESIVIMAVVGALGGWLAGFVMKGGGYGLRWDIALGVVGGIVGGSVLGIAFVRTPSSVAGAAFVAAFIVVVAQRKFWNVKLAAAR
jgi:uncharacterized membrane protein YeaQ/YmgE (transglycosylase-associated protein family)